MQWHYETLDPDWDELPSWLPRQHYRGGSLDDVVLSFGQRYIPPYLPSVLETWLDYATTVEINPALVLVSSGAGMTPDQWKAMFPDHVSEQRR